MSLKCVTEPPLNSISGIMLSGLTEIIISKRYNNDSFQVILTLNPNLELPALPEPALNNASLACRQRDLQPHKELEVGLLLEQVAANHSIIISHLRTRAETWLMSFSTDNVTHEI